MSLNNGLKFKKEDFKSINDEIRNIKGNINEEMSNIGVYMNEKQEFVWRANKKKLYEKSSPDQKYDLNEILKYYELNKNKYLQGFTSNYFRKLSELMVKNKNKNYSKERLDLFNSRINQSQKIYIEHLKKNGKDSEIKSSLNKKIKNPFVTCLHSYNNKNNKFKIGKKDDNIKLKLKNNILYSNYINNQNPISSNNISTLTFNDYDKKISKIKITNNNELSYNSTSREGMGDHKNKYLTKYLSYKNILITNNNKSKTNSNISFSFQNIKKNNSVDYNFNDGKEEIFKNMDQDKYFNYLKNQYHFYDEYNNKNQINFDKKRKRRKNLFNLKPNSKFLEKIIKNTCKIDFFKKKKKKINDNSPNIKINNNTKKNILKKKFGNLPTLSARFLKSMKFNNECHSIYEHFKKNLIK